MAIYSSFRRIDSASIINKQVTGVDIEDNVTLNGNAGIKLPIGTTEQRSNQGNLQGTIRFNSTTNKFEANDGTSWGVLNAGATGGGSDEVFIENNNIISSNYTISTGKNAVSVGPITINNGVTITIPNNSRWVIL